jgi:hypothetical protein
LVLKDYPTKTTSPQTQEAQALRAALSMASHNNDELLPEQTQGFKVGEKKTIDEYHQMGMFKFLYLKCLQIKIPCFIRLSLHAQPWSISRLGSQRSIDGDITISMTLLFRWESSIQALLALKALYCTFCRSPQVSSTSTQHGCPVAPQKRCHGQFGRECWKSRAQFLSEGCLSYLFTFRRVHDQATLAPIASRSLKFTVNFVVTSLGTEYQYVRSEIPTNTSSQMLAMNLFNATRNLSD